MVTAPRVAVYNVDWGLYPRSEENPRALGIWVTLEAGVTYQLHLESELSREQLSNVQTIKIDNADGANPVTIQTSKTRDRIIIPQGTQSYQPLLLGDDTILEITRADAGILNIFLINMPMPIETHSTEASGAIVTIAGGTITSITDPVAVTVANGADVALGATTDAAQTNPATNASLIAFIRGVLTFVSRIPALGQATMVNSTPVAIASNQSAVPVSATDGALATLGTTTDATVTNPATNSTLISFIRGVLTYVARIPALGQATMANSAPVVIASDQSTVKVSQDGGATGTLTVTNFTAASQTIAAANTARKGGVYYNNSVNPAYVRLEAAAASATNFTYLVPAGGTLELPFNYKGELRGFSGVATGAFNWTELT